MIVLDYKQQSCYFYFAVRQPKGKVIMDYDIQCEEFYNEDEMDGQYEMREAYLERLAADISIDECDEIYFEDEYYFEDDHAKVMGSAHNIILKQKWR